MGGPEILLRWTVVSSASRRCTGATLRVVPVPPTWPPTTPPTTPPSTPPSSPSSSSSSASGGCSSWGASLGWMMAAGGVTLGVTGLGRGVLGLCPAGGGGGGGGGGGRKVTATG